MGFLVFALSLLLFFMSIVPLLPPVFLWMWQMTVLSTEFGHWFTVVCSILCFLCLWGGKRFSAGIFLVCAVIFLGPVFELQTHWFHWKVILDERIGLETTTLEPIPSFFDLWHKTKLPQTSEKFFYRESAEASSRLEFFRARGPGKKPAPFVLVIPGGSWCEADPSSFWELNSDLAENGIAVASISYRILPEHHWPAQKEDVDVALQYLRDHAKELNIDPNNWAVLGRSAGGQIAESLAYEKKPTGLKGLIAFYAPADLDFAYKYSKPDDILKTSILLNDFVVGAGHKAAKEDFDKASPYQYVSSKSVPTLLFHGPRDPLVWVLQSERLQQRLFENKVPVVFIEVPWGTHGFDYNFSGPGSQLSTYTIHRFLNKVLR